jgi:hypothetical protein
MISLALMVRKRQSSYSQRLRSYGANVSGPFICGGVASLTAVSRVIGVEKPVERSRVKLR